MLYSPALVAVSSKPQIVGWLAVYSSFMNVSTLPVFENSFSVVRYQDTHPREIAGDGQGIQESAVSSVVPGV